MADETEAPTLEPGLLARPLSPSSRPELAGDDPRLDRVGTLVAKSDYAGAAAEASSLIAEGFYDVRLVGPYLLGSFLETGMLAMPVVFESVIATLTTNWAVFGPERRKQNLADNGVRWLFKLLVKMFEFHERQRDDVWDSWLESPCRVAVQDALAHAKAVEAAIAQALPTTSGGATDLFRKITSWLEQHARALQTQVIPLPQVTEKKEAEKKEAPKVEEAPEPPRAIAAGPGVPVSLALAELLRKLRAFDDLVKKEDFTKAGVIAADVLSIVENFDPRVYLPTIFAGFYAGLSAHIESLEPVLMSGETLAQKALTQLYRMDLDAFLKLGGE